jgi:hypothetical protein
MSSEESLSVDINALSDGFQTSLSDALDRAFSRLEASKQAVKAHESKVHKAALGSV